jgi:hypothetical protein
MPSFIALENSTHPGEWLERTRRPKKRRFGLEWGKKGDIQLGNTATD